MQTGRLLSVMLGFAVGGFLAGFRYNAFGTAHRSIADRFLLPVRPIDLATASGKGLTLLPAGVACLVVAWAWQRVGWPGPAAFTLWLVLPVCVLVGGLGFGAYSSVRWPYPVDVGFFSLNVPPAPGGFLALLCFVALAAGPPFLLEDLLAVDAAWGPPAAALGGVVLMLCAVAVGILLVRAADRLAQADPHRILELLTGRRTEDRTLGPTG